MSEPKRTVHVISHTHWDREWYMPYEAHHVKLVETLDTLLETFERDPEFRSFYLDGQSIVLEDYLQIYPEKRERMRQLVREGKLSAGPWYVLQDEFLTSSEANVRNLQIGHRDAREFGPVSKVGYFPDSFGNMGQAPQLLRQAGIENAVFGRGVKATGFNNQVGEEANLESPFSELIWESPDGSRVLGILFANWYNNGMEIPVEREAAQAYWDHRLASAERYASTPHLLLMNGCDHQPVQTDLSEALRVARELYPDYEFIHSNFKDYIASVEASLPSNLSRTRGELRGQKTDGWFTLANTASARVPVKQRNQENQTLLEKVAEPLATLAHAEGKPYPHALFTYAWKTLMQNHPHDSICGCSVDEVYREMETRFAKSIEVANSIVADSAAYLSAKADTSVFANAGESAAPFVVYNTSGYEGSSVLAFEVELAKRYFNQSENPRQVMEEVRGRTHGQGYLVNHLGERIDCTAEDLGVRFGYDLPNDKFRQPYMARAIRLTFETGALPAMGHAAYAWVSDRSAGGSADAEAAASLVVDGTTLENGYLRVTVEADGGLTLLDKRTGQRYAGLGHYEDVGDVGNEYIFRQPEGDSAITTHGGIAEIRVSEDRPYRATLEIVQRISIPASADERLETEMNEMVSIVERKAGRSSERVPLAIVTTVSLEREGKGVRVQASFGNLAKDHRVRVLYPTDVAADAHYADSIFEVAERATKPSAEWRNPCNAQHMQAFVDLHGGGRGLTVAGKGLNEYEALQDDRGTLAVTLLRSVGELGDWGVFPTPEAQCLGAISAEWTVIPHGGDDRIAAYREAHRFQVPVTVGQTGVHAGSLPPRYAFLRWDGEGLLFSNLKTNEERGDLMARWYNVLGSESELRITTAEDSVPYVSSIMETKSDENVRGALAVGKYRIVTAGWRTL
ncbi:alpha-mannosidase [Cohnella nanjingensis]|uniref:Alpha-mannosidase n=1 Tax=Cohnella nanjingensis TaxID=1387779 RepID=A0A7X0RUX6_9BACL|nr:alpha-mannosidase [Cohnella nanjingensis]MBB6674038.1 alpha-mannosidase [Cohnella nanjingensis]